MTDTDLSSAERTALMLDAFHAGDLDRVLLLGEALGHAGEADDTALLLLGAAQHGTRRIRAAMTTFQTLTRRQPTVFEYWNNLGIVAREADELDTAEHALRQAANLAPTDAQVQYNLGLLHAQQQRWLDARYALLAAVELSPDFIEARLQAAHACHICGDNLNEEALLAGAADWPPQPLEQALILSTMLATHGELGAALRVLEQAKPDDNAAEAAPKRIHALRAALYERGNQLEQAEAELRALPVEWLNALPEEQTRLRCEGWLAHAALAARRGQHEHASTLYREVLATSTTHDMRANAAFGLAGSLDKLGRHTDAWHVASLAHEAQLHVAGGIVPELLQPNSTPLAMSQHRVSRREYDRWNALPAPRSEKSPVFVVGFPRSGTTLLEQMIDAHPAFCSMDERAFIHELTERMTLAGQAYPSDLATLTPHDADQLRAVYAGLASNVVPALNGRQLVDKNPLNMLCLPMIARLFPEARIILCLRHPCDVLLSCTMQAFRSPAFMVLCSSLERLARGYVQAFEQWQHHAEVFWPRVLEWRYESVVARFDEHVERLGHFLQVDDSAPMRRYAEHAAAKRHISTPSYAQVTQGIHSKAVNRWHGYREQFAPVLPLLKSTMDRLGYDA